MVRPVKSNTSIWTDDMLKPSAMAVKFPSFGFGKTSRRTLDVSGPATPAVLHSKVSMITQPFPASTVTS